MAVDRAEEIKTELQSLGVRIETGDGDPSLSVRAGGAGPAEGITLMVSGSPASVPLSSPFVQSSPFLLSRNRDRWMLFRHGDPVDLDVALLARPSFYDKTTHEGIPYAKIGLFHGADCFASSVLQSCSYWGRPAGCRFCGIGLSWKAGKTVLTKEPDQLVEAARAAVREGARHVTLTAGTTEDRKREWNHFQDCARALVEAHGLPVHVQVMPPFTRSRMEALREAGVASLGVHLESFDSDLLLRFAPCKASVPREAYLRAWRDGVEVFGRGQVSTFLLAGLGEDPAGLLDGCERLARLGVYPYLVPFRPIPGTPLASRTPIPPDKMTEIYRKAARMLHQNGLDWASSKAGCVRCRGCSALPDYQDALMTGSMKSSGVPEEIEWEVVPCGPFLEASFAIRHEVFVQEQRLFQVSDRDGWDPDSIHIVARQGSRCLGTVRITPLGQGTWVGSRLAVRMPWRGGVGSRLVAKAEEEVNRRGGRAFFAYIQPAKVAFFLRCGWTRVGEVSNHCGRPHTLMKAAGGPWKQELFPYIPDPSPA